MNRSDCYRLLELTAGATYGDVKAAYRRLVRRYHPDLHPDKGDWAKDKFIELNRAYRTLMAALASPQVVGATVSSPPRPAPPPTATIPISSPLSAIDHRLKQQTYQQLQQFLKTRRFPRAIALIEGLAQRLPGDPEVRQWQAIAYQRWARHLAEHRHYGKAQIYLKKALKTDPHNRSLWNAIRQDFDWLQQLRLKHRSGC